MRSFAFCSSLALLIASATCQSATDANRIPLWNGKDLSGWHGQRHFDPIKLADMQEDKRAALLAEDEQSATAHWRCENGELINDGHGAFLTTDKSYGDAVFWLEYKTVAKADSGIYLRATPQVQIWDYTEAGGKWNLGADKGSGGLWNNKVNERFPPATYDKPFGQWNGMKITIVGERVWVELNGQTAVDGVRMENFWDRTKPLPKTGPLQLQTHGGEIRFRNLWVHELSAQEGNMHLASRNASSHQQVFDGKTFAGWLGNLDSYKIEDGAVRCKAGKGGHIFTKTVYRDFSAQLEFQLPPGGNNGLAMRYSGKGDPAYKGFELQVIDNTADKYKNLKPYQYHGSAYGMAPALRGYQRSLGEWNFQQVTMVGSRVTVELNGYLILDANLKDLKSSLPNHTGKDNPTGHFGFCGHNDAVAYRNIRIRKL